MADSEAMLRDRAFLAVLLLVGAAAIASGLYQLIWLDTSMTTGIFDAVLGLTVLLVTWLFLAPYVLPATFGLPEPAARRAADPTGPAAGRPSPVTSHRPEPRSPPVPATPPSAIPRWADPLVDRSLFSSVPVRPASVLAASPAPPAADEVPAEDEPSVNALGDEVPDWLETGGDSSSATAQASQVIDELDQISTQLGPDHSLRSSRRLSPVG